MVMTPRKNSAVWRARFVCADRSESIGKLDSCGLQHDLHGHWRYTVWVIYRPLFVNPQTNLNDVRTQQATVVAKTKRTAKRFG